MAGVQVMWPSLHDMFPTISAILLFHGLDWSPRAVSFGLFDILSSAGSLLVTRRVFLPVRSFFQGGRQ